MEVPWRAVYNPTKPIALWQTRNTKRATCPVHFLETLASVPQHAILGIPQRPGMPGVQSTAAMLGHSQR